MIVPYLGHSCQYLESCIERTPDIYVSELQDELCQARGVVVSESTIIRTLQRKGFVRKKVNNLFYLAGLLTSYI
jgi:hypothetical protein